MCQLVQGRESSRIEQSSVAMAPLLSLSAGGWHLDPTVLNSGKMTKVLFGSKQNTWKFLGWQAGCSPVPGSFLVEELDLLDEISTSLGGLFQKYFIPFKLQ